MNTFKRGSFIPGDVVLVWPGTTGNSNLMHTQVEQVEYTRDGRVIYYLRGIAGSFTEDRLWSDWNCALEAQPK